MQKVFKVVGKGMRFTTLDDCLLTMLSDSKLDGAGGGYIHKAGVWFSYLLSYEELTRESIFLRVYPASNLHRQLWIVVPTLKYVQEAKLAFDAFTSHPHYHPSLIAWYTADH